MYAGRERSVEWLSAKHAKITKKKLIRNSTAEFLIFTGQAGEQSIEARYEDETIWG